MNHSLTITQYFQSQRCISDLITLTIEQINLQLSNYQLISDFTVYSLIKVQENGQQDSKQEPIAYTKTLQQTKWNFFSLQPIHTNNFIHNPQIECQVPQKRKTGYINFQSIASTQGGMNSEKNNQDNGSILMESYSKGISQLLEIQSFVQNYENEEDYSHCVSQESKDSLNDYQEQKQLKCIKTIPVDQPPHQIGSCSFFSFLNLFRNKKQK
eukprot:TRINITY_DN25091_c0_g1_i1.p1 TRINITY_DN25091_c0_g1~~TRINITY_DN25091_c0_g1_i1.p1  ORF type:complete len:212 (-),score=19.80 TRINITY_DN25091_c0_g1_i1:41-676(-)